MLVKRYPGPQPSQLHTNFGQMDERVGSVMRVLHAMEELDHSELTRGNVKAASRAVDSLNNEVRKETGTQPMKSTTRVRSCQQLCTIL